MGILVTVDGFDSRFPNTGISSGDINDIWLQEGAEWVHSSIAEHFIVPTSTSNITASRLAYQKAWHLIRLRTIDPTDSEEMGASLDEEIQALIEGKKAMVHSGTEGEFFEYARAQDVDPGMTIWSNTMDYKPTFDIDDPERQKRDRDHLSDLRNARD